MAAATKHTKRRAASGKSRRAAYAETTAVQRSMRLKAGSPAAIALEDARRAGLLLGERDQHVSFRAPKALVEAAMREAGVTSPTDLGMAALAVVAQPDPVAAFFRETHGDLGPDFDLDY